MAALIQNIKKNYFVWKHTDSNAARIICFFVVNAVSPQIILEYERLDNFILTGFITSILRWIRFVPSGVWFPIRRQKPAESGDKVNITSGRN